MKPKYTVQMESRNVTDIAKQVGSFLSENSTMVRGFAHLTNRELQYFLTFREVGFDHKLASAKLGISVKTGDIHWAKIRDKLGDVNSYQAVHFLAVFLVANHSFERVEKVALAKESA